MYIFSTLEESIDNVNSPGTVSQVLMSEHEAVAPEARRETVAFVIPLYNEEEVVPHLVRELEAYRSAHPEVAQVILVDDGSTDRTVDVLRTLTAERPGYFLLQFSRNFGHQLAISAGMNLADTDAVVVMDADLQDPLWVVDEMVNKWREGYDVVYGVRERRGGETLFKRATAALFYRFFRWMTDLSIPLDTGDFRLVSRRVLDAYRRIEEQQPFVRGLITWLGFNQTGISYEREARVAGATKYTLGRMFRLATGSLTSFSGKPLRLAIQLGLTTSALSILGLIWVLVVKYIFKAAITGWASVIFALFFFGGVQLFFLGIVGIYLVRVYEEVKARPRYVVKEQWTSKVPGAAADHLTKQSLNTP